MLWPSSGERSYPVSGCLDRSGGAWSPREIFPRYDWDPNPKGPIWETSHTPRVASPEEYADTVAAIRRHLA